LLTLASGDSFFASLKAVWREIAPKKKRLAPTEHDQARGHREMAEYSDAIFTDKTTKHVALLQYISEQLRCYAEEFSAKDGVLPTFASMLDQLARELAAAENADNVVQPARRIAVQ
jgi:hypothetical protein